MEDYIERVQPKNNTKPKLDLHACPLTVLYSNVQMPPKVLQMIQEQAKWLTASAMAARIQSVYSQVTTKQIHKAWREQSETYWQCNDEQLPSVKMLLAEYCYEHFIFTFTCMLTTLNHTTTAWFIHFISYIC